MTVLVVLSSLMRYLVGSPFRFTEEIVGLLFAAMAFLVWPLSTLRGDHIAVTFMSERLPTWTRPLTKALSALAMLVFCAIFGRESYEFAVFTLQLGGKSDVAEINFFPWMILMAIVCVLMVVAVIIRSVSPWLRLKLPVDVEF